MAEHKDERRSSEFILKNFVLPIIIAILIGVPSSYVATKITLAVMETKVEYIESDIGSIKDILRDVSANQLLLAKGGEQLNSLDRRVSTLEETIKLLVDQTRDRYTRSDADRDTQTLAERITTLERKVNK